MRYRLLAILAALVLPACHRHVVVHESAPRPPPPGRTSVYVSYGWSHHRYAVWTEYYYCNDEEVYYLENCGYDDDDILVCLYLARRAGVPLRYAFYEYDRCGRSFYTTSLCFRLPWNIWFCREVPRYYSGCPALYARCYGYYWSNEPHYYSNAEIHALVQFQVGVRYYGYSHATYFREYDACAQRGDRSPFRTIVVKDHTMAARGGKNCDEKAVVVRAGRPFEARPQEWDKMHKARTEEVRVKVTPQHERDEQDKARRAGEERKEAHEAAKHQLEEAKVKRQEADHKHEAEERAKGPKPAGPGPAARPGPVKKVEDSPGEPKPRVGGPDKTPGPPPVKGPEPKRTEPAPKVNEPAPPPKKGPEPPRKEEPVPGKKVDDGGPKKGPPPPPPQKRQDDPGPGKKADDGGPKKGPPPPPPPPPPPQKKQDDPGGKGSDKKK